MDFLLLILAVVGFLAVLRLSLVAGLMVLGRGVEAFLAREVTEAHARRGDITSLQAAQVTRSKASRARVHAVARLALTVALLVAPVLSPWPRLIYAAYSPLWLLFHRRRV
jgi:hypothetical protein